MPGLLIIALMLVGGIWALRRMGRMKPREVRKFQRQLLGAGLVLASLFFVVHGNLWMGLPVMSVGALFLGLSHLLPQGLSPTYQTPPHRSSSGSMDKTEALNVLGLQRGATVEAIKAAHKRLQRANHPDSGGTDYLAAKINQARDILLDS